MIETLSVLKTIFFILSGILFVITVTLWFVFKIPSVIGYLSGKVTRRSVSTSGLYGQAFDNKKFHLRLDNIEADIDNNEKKEEGSKTISRTKDIKDDVIETGILSDNAASLITEDITIPMNDETQMLDYALDNDNITAQITMGLPQNEDDPYINLLDEVVFIHTDAIIV
ncbi:MAG: hypothetical protein ACI4II_07670 [Acutalibacteraceae bacterium]